MQTTHILALCSALAGSILAAPVGAAPVGRQKRAATVARPAPPKVLSVRVEPAAVALTGPEARQQILVTGKFSDGAERDLTRAARYVSDARLTVSPEGVAAPRGEGSGLLKIQVAGRILKLPVIVTSSKVPPPTRFVTDVLPVFTKIGCNSGACHGAAAGKSGFRLSLRGFDPALDFEQLTKDKSGARIDTAHPEESLLLKKATGLVEHGGGPRFRAGSEPYNLVLRWLQEGAAGPDAAVQLTDIEVRPAERVIPKPGLQQQLQVTARYSDSSSRDVTRWARFASQDSAIVSVDDDTALLKAEQGGDGTVMVSYSGFVKVARALVPVQDRSPVDYARLPRANFIDDRVIARLAQLRIEPSASATDAEFLRRAHLDLIGTLPTPAEVTAFLEECDEERTPPLAAERVTLAADERTTRRSGPDASSRPLILSSSPPLILSSPPQLGAARARLIDSLLARPEFIDYRALKLADLFRVNSLYTSQEGADAFYRWIRGRVRENVGYDKLVREVLSARGSGYHVGPANYFLISRTPEELAETTSQSFLGVRLNCSKCHNHPFERWQQKDYYSLAAFFAKVGRKGGPEFGESQVIVKQDGQVKHPKSGDVLAPKFLGDREPAIGEEQDRRVVLADWLTSKDNLLFARVAVNRLWADLFGRGIVDPVDDFRVSNPPSNDALLEALAHRFIELNFDVRAMLREIANSRTYQLSSEMRPSNERDTRHFARAYPKRLPAEVLADALDDATGKPSRYGQMPAGTRALQLPDSRIGSYVLEIFGRPKREIVCACERDPQPNLSQMLNLVNSSELNGRIAAGDGRIAKAIGEGLTDEQIVNHLYLATLCRPPGAEELRIAADQVSKVGGRKQALEDVLWALINTQEFLFNH